MRFYSWKMLLYILFLTATGIVSGIYLLKVTACNWWNCLTISLIFWKWSWVQSFHLDGQTIVLDDYLEIRPENRDRCNVISTRASSRLVPSTFCRMITWSPVKPTSAIPWLDKLNAPNGANLLQIGYFPDTFGNMGQAPQILQKSGIHVAAFGRGVKPIGFDTRSSKMSSLPLNFLKCTGKGRMVAVCWVFFFANWYSNGNEIPVDKDEALAFWKQNCQMFVTMHRLINGWWWTDGSPNQFNEI